MSQPSADPRANRLRSLFHKIIHGDQILRNVTSAKLFIEAICNQPDRVQCVQKISSSLKGLSSLQTALSADTSLEFLNTSAASFLTYIQTPELALISQGEFLRNILLAITEPPIFWNAFVRESQAARLGNEALQCFSWLLVQLVSLPSEYATPYYGVASSGVQRMLLESSQLSVRTNGQKLKHVMETIKCPEHHGGEGPGGRHDNDDVNIREIAILPTPDEISSTDPPYLRRATEIDECSADGRFAMHIDNQFRLLREDMLRDLREGLQLSLGLKKGRRKGLSIEGLQIQGIVVQERQQWALRLQCDKDLPQFNNVKPDARKKFVSEFRGFVKHQSLACLIADGEVTALVTIVRDEDLLAHDPPILCVQFSGKDDSIVKALSALKQAKQVRLIQLSTAMFAYEPVLKRLQEIKELALKDEIMLWDPDEQILAAPILSQASITDLVMRLRHDPSADLKQVLDLPKPTQLDPSQASCLLGGLTQKLSLVQGPPGTGKSFIGALIAKAIYRFSTETILVVCYTNHALDQFLEDLLNVGIPADSMVRLGSYKKASAATQPLILSNQQGSFKPGQSYYDMLNKYKQEMSDDANRLRDAFSGYEARAVSKPDLMAYLEFDLDCIIPPEAFVLPRENNGMTKVGKKGKQIDEYYLLDRWARGQDAGSYKVEAEASFPEVWHMKSQERQHELERWKSEILKERVSKVVDCGKQHNKTLAHIESLHSEKDRMKIKEKRIIGCTTTGAAIHVQAIHSVSPGVLLVEEAGEILESHVLTALGTQTEQLVLIGDHKQLRPKTHHDLSVEKGEGYDLNRSMFERLILRGYPHQILHQQHRMRPQLSSLVRNLTYPELTDAPSTKSRSDVKGLQDNLVFLNHEHTESEVSDVHELRDENSTSSKSSEFEAKMTLRCVRYLGQQGYGTGQIVVLTPYVAQLRLLFDVLAEENDPILNDLDKGELVQAGLMPAASAQVAKRQIRISTIDNYQGEESDIVVVSLTRSNPRGDIGFLSSPERLNVLLSRARDALILIGNARTFLHSRKGKTLWGKFFDLLKDGSHIYDGLPVRCERHPDRQQLLRSPDDFDKCPNGGCDEPCNVTLKCDQHACPQSCHRLVDHSKMPCEQPVKSKCIDGHVQTYTCHKGKPASCRTCERAKKEREKKLLDEQKRQEKRDKEQQEHADKIAAINEEIRLLQEAAVDKQRLREMAQALEQKRKDLEDAKRLQERPQRPKVTPRTPPAVSDKDSDPDEEHEKSDEHMSNDDGDPSEPPINTHVKPSVAETEWNRQKDMENASNDSLDTLMKMTGLEEVKEQFLTIKAKTEIALRQNKQLKSERFGIVLLGNPGTGKTTVARLYAKFLTSMGVLSGTEFVETTGARLASDGVAGAKALIDQILKADGGAFFLDEAYQLALGHNYGGASVLDFLLAEIENRVGTIVFIFAGYNKQMEKFFEHNPGLTSRMPYRLQFADYNDGELLQMFGRKLEKEFNGNMKVERGIAGLYARVAVRRLGRGRNREGFGNARALENILSKIYEQQSRRIQHARKNGNRPDDLLLKKEDLIGPEPSQAVTNSPAWKELHSLIGLKSVKESMQNLADSIFLNYQRELAEKEIVETSLNRVFLGSPGTGKTSVGKLYGQTLADMGILSNGEVVIKNPADFVGDVLGASEKNTKAILKATEGKVLIIDEAYMLYAGGAGKGNTTDLYKTAVIDTIVAEVQSTLGEDRCVLLLGYEDEMRNMFQNVNPGLARRFRIEDSFLFEDFDDVQLREILELKLKKQGLLATIEAKDVAISMLARARHRPNFGNAGEVENLISRAKTSHQSRQSAKPASERPVDVCFEPQDFDADYNRAANASVNCRALFKDVLGCDGIVDKLESYVSTANSMRARNIDPRKEIPFNFIFKGPPGTGKTTTARKMGQVFYDMGFLSTKEVVECSATDLVGSYVGHTGPKTVALLEKALGKVLFIDEAYRLGENSQFTKEAINELVDSLTKEKFLGKIIVVLAGYEFDMNDLLAVNPGLSSRFSEEIVFTNLEPKDAWNLLRLKLKEKTISIDETDQIALSELLRIFKELSALPAWGNGRDVDTIAKAISSSVIRAEADPMAQLRISLEGINRFLAEFLIERTKRSAAHSARKAPPDLTALPTRISNCHPDSVKTSQSTSKRSQTPVEPGPPLSSPKLKPQECDERDPGVSDATWSQLQADKAAIQHAQEQKERALAAAAEAERQAIEKAAAAAAEAERLAAQQAKDEEERRRQEEARRKHLEALRLQREAEDRARRLREEVERKRKEEERVQTKLRNMGVCVQGFQWIKHLGGYRCAGGAHWVSDGELGI